MIQFLNPNVQLLQNLGVQFLQQEDEIVRYESEGLIYKVHQDLIERHSELLGLALDSELCNDNFQYNEHGVCLNPEVVYHHMEKNDLAWCYVQIVVSEYEGMWAWGQHHIGGCGGASICNAKYTKEEAIQKGIDFMKIRFQQMSSSLISDTQYNKYKRHFQQWVISRNQLSLF